MYVVTKDVYKLPVDNSSIDYENEYCPFQQTVGLYEDCTVLKDVWILRGYKDNYTFNPAHNKDDRYEFVSERRYDHEPSKEEILWFMSSVGLTRYDIVSVDKCLMLDMNDED